MSSNSAGLALAAMFEYGGIRRPRAGGKFLFLGLRWCRREEGSKGVVLSVAVVNLRMFPKTSLREIRVP